MTQIILDFSANTHKNDKSIIKRAIDEIKAVDSEKHEIVFKGQLFKEAGENIVCTHKAFQYMHAYGNENGYKVTASVFDKESLDFLLKFDVPFVKIANRPDLYWLGNEVPRKIDLYVSSPFEEMRTVDHIFERCKNLECVSMYPAPLALYEGNIFQYYSDHVVGLALWYKFHPEIWEKHLNLSDSTGLDAGSFAITPQELKEIL